MPIILSSLRFIVVMNDDNFGMVWVIRSKRMNFEIAKSLTKGNVFFTRDVLISEENDFPIQ